MNDAQQLVIAEVAGSLRENLERLRLLELVEEQPYRYLRGAKTGIELSLQRLDALAENVFA